MQQTTRAHVCTSHRRALLANYTGQQQDALITLLSVAKRHLGSSGGRTAALVLLGLYNGPRFPLDLTELRTLDAGNLAAAITVIQMDAARTHAEVHDILNALLGVNWVGSQLELWAYQLRLPKRCKKEALPSLQAHVEGGAA